MCDCKRYAAVLAANLALRKSSFPVNMVKDYGLLELFGEQAALYATGEGSLGMQWLTWKEGNFFVVAGAKGAGVFDQQEMALRCRDVVSASFSRSVASWELGVKEVETFLDRFYGGPQQSSLSVGVEELPPVSEREKRRREEESSRSQDPKRVRGEEQVLSLKDLVALVKKGDSSERKQDRLQSRAEKLRNLSEGEWLAEELPLHKFFVREEEREEGREVRMVGGVLSAKVPKKKVANQAEWMEANVNILSTCPTDKMRQEYMGYMKRAAEVWKQYSFADFRRFDEGYRRRRFEERAPWTEQYPELWLKLLKGPTVEERRNSWPAKKREGGKICRFFNQSAGCKKGTACDFPHKCGLCGEGHSKVNCLKKEK
mgnify:CR=1 FL=1